MCNIRSMALVLVVVVAAASASASFGQSIRPLFSDVVLGGPYPLTGPSLLPTIGDLDGDGLIDLLDARLGSATISVWYSEGRLRWRDPVPVAELDDRYPLRGIVAADMNADGRDDLVYWGGYAIAKTARFGVLLADGAGGFVAGDSVTIAISVDDSERFDTIEVGDVTGDGFLDIVAAPFGVVVIPGAGGGTLGDPISIPATNAFCIEVADLDGDGQCEIIADGFDPRSVDVIRYQSGMFVVTQTFDLGFDFFTGLNAIEVVVLNSPGQLAVYCAGSEAIQALTVSEDGTLAAGPKNTNIPRNFNVSSSFLVADVLGGPQLDLILPGTQALVDLDVDLNGTPTDLMFLGSAATVAIADAALDGSPDLFFGSRYGITPLPIRDDAGGVRVFDALLTGELDGFDFQTLASVAIADFDHDGRDEAAVSAFVGGGVAVFGLDETGELTGVPINTLDDTARLTAGDVDGDGNADIIVPDGDPEDVVVLFGDGLGGFPSRLVLPVADLPSGEAVLCDFDGDGDLDIVVGDQSGHVLLRQTSPRIFEEAWRDAPADGAFGSAAGDLNGDGFEDVMWGFTTGVGVYFSDGSMGFEPPVRIETGIRSESVGFGDFDGDGDLDAVHAGWPDIEVAVLENDVAGGFTHRVTIALTRDPSDEPPFQAGPVQFVRVGDIDADGKLDIAALDNAGWVHILLGDGEFGFTLSQAVGPTGSWQNQIALGDIDGDGLLDVAIGYGYPSGGDSIPSGAHVRLNTLTRTDLCSADLAVPFGLLDLADITAFIVAFTSMDSAADHAAPFGIFDLADIVAFVTVFGEGCDG